MKYTLKSVLRIAERYGIPHRHRAASELTKTTEGLLRIATLVDSPMLRVNYDTGNAFLAGEDPYEGSKRVADRVVHMHAKDISVQHAEAEKGKVTGTPVGCACGDGVIDWATVVAILNGSRLRRRAVGGVRNARAGGAFARPFESR